MRKFDEPALVLARRVLPWVLALAFTSLIAPPARGQANKSKPRPPQPEIRIDLDHILQGRINRQGELVGMHHEPSAPEKIRYRGVLLDVEFRYTSEGDGQAVRTARVVLVDPKDKKVVLEKFSTCFPADWKPHDIEACIRDAYADAKARNRIERNGRWSGFAKDGKRIDGYMSYDGTFIATAFPVLPPPPRGTDRRDRGRP